MQIFIHFLFLLAFVHLSFAGDDESINSADSAPHSPNLNLPNEITEPSLHLYPIPAPHPALAGLREQEAVRKSPLLRTSSGLKIEPESEVSRKFQRIESSRSPRGRDAVSPPPSIRVPSSDATSAERPLTDVFKNYVNVGHFYRHGLRYGTIPPSHLPVPVSSTGEEFAKVLLPQDVRWTFPRPQEREQAYRVALGQTSHSASEQARKAEEVLRMYQREATQIQQVIESRGELPLYTSEEWKEWVKQHGPELMLAPWKQGRFRESVRVEAFNAQNRISRVLTGQEGEGEVGEVIKLEGKEEKIAANVLVSLWTAAHERILRDVRP